MPMTNPTPKQCQSATPPKPVGFPKFVLLSEVQESLLDALAAISLGAEPYKGVAQRALDRARKKGWYP